MATLLATRETRMMKINVNLEVKWDRFELINMSPIPIGCGSGQRWVRKRRNARVAVVVAAV